MSKPCTVLIAAPPLIDAMRERAAADGDVLSFSDRDVLQALEAIQTRQPRAVTLERLFAATSRGAALINRIKADPSLASVEIRVVSHDGTYSRVSPRRVTAAPAPAAAPVAPPDPPPSAEPAPPPYPPSLDHHGTRRAQRFKMAEGTTAQLENTSATVLDLSVIGAQMVCELALRPHQKVRVVLSDDAGTLKIAAVVAWAFFEMKPAPRYRAGLEFTDALAPAVDAYCKRHLPT